MVGLALLPYLEKEARERQGTRTDLLDIPQIIGESSNKHSGEALEQAAKLAGTNREYIRKVDTLAPEQQQAVLAGTLTIPEALTTIRREQAAVKREELVALPVSVPFQRVQASIHGRRIARVTRWLCGQWSCGYDVQ